MPWSAQIHPDHPIVELGYSGMVSRAELVASLTRVLELASRHGTRLLLTDLTLVEGGYTVVDLFFVGEELFGTTDFRSLREALVVGEFGSSQRGGFWETYCVNRGVRIQSFRDHSAALRWLLAA